jgi:hypothetical protein
MGDTWYLTLKEEHRFRIFETRVLRRWLAPEREKVKEDGSNIAVEWAALLLRIWEVSGSSLGLETGYSD